MKKELHKKEFAKRLNDSLDELPEGFVRKGEGRQYRLAKMFAVDPKAARKWLEGEGYPALGKSIQLAMRLNVSIEWLLTGRGSKRIMDQQSESLAELLDIWARVPEVCKQEILNFARFADSKVSRDNKKAEHKPTSKPH